MLTLRDFRLIVQERRSKFLVKCNTILFLPFLLVLRYVAWVTNLFLPFSWFILLVSDRINKGGNATPSVRPHVRPSIDFRSIFGTDWPFTLKFCLWVCHDHSSQTIESQGHRPRSRSWVRLVQSVSSFLFSLISVMLAFFICCLSALKVYMLCKIIVLEELNNRLGRIVGFSLGTETID